MCKGRAIFQSLKLSKFQAYFEICSYTKGTWS
jgi:hypothetical protein